MHSRIFGMVEKDYYDNHKDEHDWELDYDEEATPENTIVFDMCMDILKSVKK